VRRTATQHDRAMTAGTGTASWACVVTGPGRGEGGGREGGGGGANPPSQGSLVFRAHTHTHTAMNAVVVRNACGMWGAGGLGLQHPGSARVPARAAQPCGGRQPPPRISPPAHPPAVLPQFSRTCTGPAAGMTPPPVYAGAAAAPTAGPSWEAGAPWLYLRCRCSGRHSPRTWAQNTSRMFRAAFSSLWGIEQGQGGGEVERNIPRLLDRASTRGSQHQQLRTVVAVEHPRGPPAHGRTMAAPHGPHATARGQPVHLAAALVAGKATLGGLYHSLLVPGTGLGRKELPVPGTSAGCGGGNRPV